MAVTLKQIDEIYEVDTEEEAEELIQKTKREFIVKKSSITYKFLKKDQREFYIVAIRKAFETEEFGE